MRVKAVQDREANPDQGKEPKADFKVTLEFVDAGQLTLLNGQPFTGKLEQAGSLFDYIQKAADKQWKMRQFNEALGLGWGDFDPEADWLGKEVTVKVVTEAYEGEQKNKVKRYIK